MAKKHLVAFLLEDERYEQFKQALHSAGYSYISEFFRESVRNLIEDYKPEVDE